jgi:cysteinyl-tRNA synthetase
MSKSSGSFLNLDRIMADGFSPLDYRYLLLTTRLRFSYESLEAAKRTRAALLGLMQRWRRERDGESAPRDTAVPGIKSAFCEHLGNDLHLPEALAFAWTLAHDQSVSATEKLEAFAFFDRVFGLGVEATGPALTAAQASLIEAREEARRRKDWSTADRLRAELLAQRIGLRDGPEGPEWDIGPDASR